MIKSNKVMITFVALSALWLTGCDLPKDANKSNFEKAINARLEKECITVSPMGMLGAKPYPVQLAVAYADKYTSQEKADERNTRQFSALDALVKSGLLTVKDTQVNEVIGFSDTGGKVPGREYALTEEGKTYLKSPGRPDFCTGHYKVDEVVDFTEPGDAMGMKITQVNYTFSPANVPEWVKSEEVRQVFPDLNRSLAEKQKKRVTLVLKNDGWSAER